MNKNFQKIKAIVIITWLVCMLAFLVSYFVSQTSISTAQIKEKSIYKNEEAKEIRGYKSWTKVNP